MSVQFSPPKRGFVWQVLRVFDEHEGHRAGCYCAEAPSTINLRASYNNSNKTMCEVKVIGDDKYFGNEKVASVIIWRQR